MRAGAHAHQDELAKQAWQSASAWDQQAAVLVGQEGSRGCGGGCSACGRACGAAGTAGSSEVLPREQNQLPPRVPTTPGKLGEKDPALINYLD